MTPDVATAWRDLLAVFFGPANRLDWPAARPSLGELMRLNEQLLARDPPGPVILPAVDLNGNTSYYAVAGDDDQARHLGEVVGAFVGPTGSTFTGRPLQPEPYDPLDGAVVRFAGGSARAFRFDVVDSERSRVQAQVRRLLNTWTARPRRAVGDVVPVGRLLDDFGDALEQGQKERARSVLYGDLLKQGRLSGPNRLFLQARFLAAFEEWDGFDLLPDLQDLLGLRRPALVSDALARLALHHLEAADDPGLAAFTETVAARFGALVPSIDTVRSPAGAAYHVLWSLHAGESPVDVAERMDGTPWRNDSLVTKVLKEALGASPAVATGAEAIGDRLESIEAALAAGLLDRAIDLLEAGPAALPLVAVLGRILRETLNLRANEVLRRYRLELGEKTVQEELDRIAAVVAAFTPDDLAPTADLPEVLSWPEVFRRLAAGELAGPPADLEELGLVDLLRGDDLDAVVEALEAVDDTAAGRVVDEGLALCRRLEGAGCDPDRLAPLRRKLVLVWCIRDRSGQRRRVEVLLEQVGKLFRHGVGTDSYTETYSEVVEQLTAGWEPFLTDQAVELSLWTLELLAGFRVPTDETLPAFARCVLSRIGPHNAGRIDRPELLVAASLATEFGLTLDFGDALETAPAETSPLSLPSPFVIGLYSLDESALNRAASLLRREYPGVTVETNSDKVATDRLKAITRRADVFVMAELSSKHAAIDAIKAARLPRPYAYAGGKGSSSLLRTVHEQIGERLAELVS